MIGNTLKYEIMYVCVNYLLHKAINREHITLDLMKNGY